MPTVGGTAGTAASGTTGGTFATDIARAGDSSRARTPADATGDVPPSRTNAELQKYVVNKIEVLKRNQFNIKKLTQLCSFIPDAIILEEQNRKIPYNASFEAVVLMADISGFTALTEAYSLRGKGGTDQLTKTLAGYIGPLAECILQAEGDIVKYAGDAFLAYWKSKDTEFAEDIQRVVECALYIQEKYGSHLCKEVDITIKVKIGIGAGTVYFSGIGTETYQHYVAFGPGVKAASAAENHCVSGDICLHPAAWSYCTPANFRYSLKEAPFVHMLDIVNLLNPEKRGRPIKSTGKHSAKKSDVLGVTQSDHGAGDYERIRPQIAIAVERKPEAVMRPFVIPPVLKKLDDDIPVVYLNESRVVSICFIQIKMDEQIDVDFASTATVVQKCFVKIYVNVTKLQGALSKVIMFDKGLTYLVVFGLPGYMNENGSAHALKFSYRTRLALKTIKYVTDVSIGVTTGSCYCGVIGHPRRQEYTVIGRKVNKAARLMVYYPGRLTCDQDTHYFSKLSSDAFKLMEAKELKGIKDVGKIYEFVNVDSSDDNSIPFFQYPLLGREAEVAYFKTALKRSNKELEQSNKTHAMAHRILGMGPQDAQTQKGIWMIIFEGDSGVGKSRLLAACISTAETMNIRVFSVGMSLATASQQFFGLSWLVIDALGMIELRTVQEREEYLKRHVKDPELYADLCLINDILHTKFPVNPKYNALDLKAGTTYGQHVLLNLLRITYPNDVILFAIDDSHHLDTYSWEYLVYLSKFPNVFTLASLRRSNAGSPKLPEAVNKQIYHTTHIKIIRMNGLEQQFLLPLSCQLMQCKAIPADLEKMIVSKSNGVPAWISQVLNEQLRVGTIRMQLGANYALYECMKTSYLYLRVDERRVDVHSRMQPDSFRNKQALVYSEKAYLVKFNKQPRKQFQRFAQDDEDSLSITSRPIHVAESTTEQINPMDRVIVIKSDTDIGKVKVSGTLKEIVLDMMDELAPAEQIILKAATVLGIRFSRQMLTRLLPQYEKAARKYDMGFVRLMENKYFRCASANAKQKDLGNAIGSKPICFCRPDIANLGEPGARTMSDMPQYYNCKFLEFVKENMVDVVYEVLTEDQRQEFHLKAGKYFDSSVIRCESCGGENRSYLFGFTRKDTDYGMYAEDAMRLMGQSHSQRMSFQQGRLEARRLSDVAFASRSKSSKSLTSQLAALRKTYDANGTRVGNVELDLLKNLLEFDHKKRTNKCGCWRSKKKKKFVEQQAEIQNFEETELQPEVDTTEDVQGENLSRVPKMGSQGSFLIASGKSIDFSRASVSDFGRASVYGSNVMVDLRTCQCAILQAKICVEMVYHYREAKKYGRCFQNLMDAAESDVTVGNGTQALVHIEDAKSLLAQIKAGELPAPDKNDQDDALIDEKEAEATIEFLSGMAYFEIGINNKAREFFLKALTRLGLQQSYDNKKISRKFALTRAKCRLCRVRHCKCCFAPKMKAKSNNNEEQSVDEEWKKRIRILSYLHSLFKAEKKMEMGLLVTFWQVIIAEQYGDVIRDVIPAYTNMMDCYTALSKHKQAIRYERRALHLIKRHIGRDQHMQPIELITGANLFLNIAQARLSRGEIESSTKAAYMSLRISQIIHDNAMIVRVLPVLCHGLLLSLRISELAEALQKLWFLAEEADDWIGVTSYYAICLDLLLNTAYPLEQFGVCENFVSNSEWKTDNAVLRDIETKFSMESSLALWYARYSRWEPAQKWLAEAESHKPKHFNFVVVHSELKLLECQLIIVNHFLDSKRYQHFAKARNAAKDLMRTLSKGIPIVPVLTPRFDHLMAYYFRIRSRNVEAEKHLRKAEKMSKSMGNSMELEWLTHSRTVWNDLAIPTIKYFWLEHTETHTLDWHASGKIPWANIMYSLPLPAWK